MLYRILSILLLPPLYYYLLRRKRCGKEHPARMGERLGHHTLARPPGQLIWLHGASVGEANSILPLIDRLKEALPHAHILVTTGTVTSAQLLSQRLPAGVIHQFVPIDSWICVHRFLKHWHPDYALWVESELWPNLITQAKAHGCKLALINARMSVKSFVKWKKFPYVIQQLLRCFDYVFAQTDGDKMRYEALGAPQVIMPGNLKHDAAPLPVDDNALAILQMETGTRPLWVAASTHCGEEEQVADAHSRIKETLEDVLTIIVPRHADRGDEITAMLRETDFRVSQRSRFEKVTKKTDIYVADTMGELGLFYRLSSVAFMGGSLIPHGGQNPLEAAKLDSALITGPYTHNFESICAELEAKNALLRVSDAAMLSEKVSHLLRQAKERETYAAAARMAATEQQGALARIAETLLPWIQQSNVQ